MDVELYSGPVGIYFICTGKGEERENWGLDNNKRNTGFSSSSVLWEVIRNPHNNYLSDN